jgi:hypothetical protein
MTQRTDLELIPDQHQIAHQMFESQSELDEFWQSLLEQVRPELERFAVARRASEEDAKRRWFR